MPRRPRTSERKLPSQERSKMTVDALVESTARILADEGYEAANTNRIAAVAGVSIGSLYQYFPSKEALVASVIDRQNEEVMVFFRHTMGKVSDQPLKVAARELVATMVEVHRLNPKLHRVLVEQMPRVGRLANIEAVDRQACELVRTYLAAHRDEIDVTDLDIAAFICVTIVEALTHVTIARRPNDIFSGDRSQVLIDEIARLVLRYLEKPVRGR
jgi:AcrR family transcriptional regulator